MSEKEQVNIRQSRAIVALIEHATITDAAAACNIGESTIRRWLATDDDFRRALREATRRLLDHAIAHAPKAADDAVKTLEAIASDEKAPHTARVAAGRYLDSRRWRAADAIDLRDEVEELKQLVAELRRAR